MKPVNYSLLVIILTAFPLFAQELPTKKILEIEYANDKPVVDGINDDPIWLDSLFFSFTFQPEMPDSSDLSAFTQLAWGEYGLYIFVSVTDDSANYLVEGEDTY